MNLTIAVIAKECSPGRVKTRLTPPLTPEQAAGLAQASLSQTLETVRSLPAARRLLVFDGTPHKMDAAGFEVFAQGTGGLDERLAAICSLTARPLLILGMDTPQLCPEQLAPLLSDWATPAPLPHRGAWFGPASDGGFWALGLYRPDGGLLRGVDMSTPQTGAQQLARLAGAGLEVGLLPILRDVDYFSDALAAARESRGTRFALAVERLGVGLPETGMPRGLPSPAAVTPGGSSR